MKDMEKFLKEANEPCPHGGYINDEPVLHKHECAVCWELLENSLVAALDEPQVKLPTPDSKESLIQKLNDVKGTCTADTLSFEFERIVIDTLIFLLSALPPEKGVEIMTGGANANRDKGSSKSSSGKSGGGGPIHTGATEGSPSRIDGDKSSQNNPASGPPGRSGRNS